MRRPKRTQQRFYVQKSNTRWKWMTGATAATAAGVTSSHAGLITINLTNNYISAFGGNHLNADLTGDGHPDLTLTGARFYYRPPGNTTSGYYHFAKWWAAVHINGVYAQGYDDGDYPIRWEILGSQFAYGLVGYVPPPLTGNIPIFFKDLGINGGEPITGSLEVTVTVDGVQLDSFTYNTPVQGSNLTAVPDQGSSLALLAMGASSVLALRRWRATQSRP